MLLPVVPLWKKAPFLRLLLPLMAGIVIQWYRPLSLKNVLFITAFCGVVFLVSLSLRGYRLFRLKWWYGLSLMLMAFLTGAMTLHFRNITHHQKWFGHSIGDSSFVVAVLSQPPIEKKNSYKANADVYAVVNGERLIKTTGSIIIYFQKQDDVLQRLKVGTTIVFRNRLQSIKNSGNPGGFDYQRYCLFKDITHQMYLSAHDYVVKPMQTRSRFERLLQESRQGIIEVLRKYLPDKREAAVAEALLIGYRDDIDRELLQAYVNTGVVHVIAISGMHLGLIYGLLILLLKPIQRRRNTKALRGVVILLALWLFALLSGAGASILRSAVMFSFIVIGESIRRPVSVYHSLSASAFFLLCRNPFFLWDVGFQLSYAAVLSIVLFYRPVSNWLYSRYNLFNRIWKLLSVTIAAQILTIPLSAFHFHQVSNLFLVSNLIVVPLSAIILYSEIGLVMLSFSETIATLIGKAVNWLLGLMNEYIRLVNHIPFVVSRDIAFSLWDAVFLFVIIACAAGWLMQMKKRMLFYTLGSLSVFCIIRLAESELVKRQHKVVVYNIPNQTFVDFIAGKEGFSMGDSALLADPLLFSYNVQPARILWSVSPSDTLKNLKIDAPYYYFKGKRILLVDSTHPGFGARLDSPIELDLIILTKNINIRISALHQLFRCPQYVFDGSNRLWKIHQWKNECDSLHLRRHSVPEDGAFVLDF